MYTLHINKAKRDLITSLSKIIITQQILIDKRCPNAEPRLVDTVSKLFEKDEMIDKVKYMLK